MQLIMLKNIRIFHLIFLLFILISCNSIAQMIPFTQNSSAPLMVNPANNGLFIDLLVLLLKIASNL